MQIMGILGLQKHCIMTHNAPLPMGENVVIIICIFKRAILWKGWGESYETLHSYLVCRVVSMK